MSKVRKLYILAAVAIPLAVVVIVLACVGGNLRTAVIFSIVSVSWGIVVFTKARKISRHQEAGGIHHNTEKIPRHRRTMIFERTFWLLVLASGIAGLTVGLVRESAMYLILEAVWFTIIGGGHFLLVSLLTDK